MSKLLFSNTTPDGHKVVVQENPSGRYESADRYEVLATNTFGTTTIFFADSRQALYYAEQLYKEMVQEVPQNKTAGEKRKIHPQNGWCCDLSCPYLTNFLVDVSRSGIALSKGNCALYRQEVTGQGEEVERCVDCKSTGQKFAPSKSVVEKQVVTNVPKSICSECSGTGIVYENSAPRFGTGIKPCPKCAVQNKKQYCLNCGRLVTRPLALYCSNICRRAVENEEGYPYDGFDAQYDRDNREEVLRSLGVPERYLDATDTNKELVVSAPKEQKPAVPIRLERFANLKKK